MIALALGTAAAVAGASWSAQGTGAAKAKAGRLEAVTATPATPSTELFPGGSAGTALTLTNPNPVAMAVTSIVGDGPITTDAEGCNTASVSFVNQTGAWEVAKNAALTVQLPNSVTMSLDANDACQGATFTIPVAVTASVSGQGGSSNPTTTTSTTSTTVPASPAQFTWSPTSYGFPRTEVNTSSNYMQNMTLRNVGGSPGSLERHPTIWGSPEIQSSGGSCFSGPVAPGAVCTIALVFRPTAPGMRTTQFGARPVGSTASFVFATVSGEGTTAPNLVFSPPSHDFGSNVNQGFDFQVTNTGGTDAQVSNFQFVGEQPGSFQVRTSTCNNWIPAGASCVLNVVYTANVGGQSSASLRIIYGSMSGSRTALANVTGNYSD